MELNNNFNSADIDTIFAEIPTSNEKQIAEAQAIIDNSKQQKQEILDKYLK